MRIQTTDLSDDALATEVAHLAHCERGATVKLIGRLAEFDARRLHLRAGYSSLFAYCTEFLRLSEHEAFNRIEAARAARKFPVILDRLAAGELNLTAVRLLAPHLTAENHAALVAAASGLSKRGVEELLARRFPSPDMVSRVRKLATRTIPLDTTTSAASTGHESNACRTEAITVVAVPSVLAPAPAFRPAVVRAIVQPLAEDRYEIRFTVDGVTRDKLRRAQDLLRHAIPNGDPAAIFDRALGALLEKIAKEKLAQTNSPRSSIAQPSSGSRHVPAAVKRAVWLRDEGRCAFLSNSGRRCSARGFLEFHHVKPYAIGGEATKDNIELRCRPHNAYEADVFYGPSRVGGGIGGRSGTTSLAQGRGHLASSGLKRGMATGVDVPP
jgi:hypothetical protein